MWLFLGEHLKPLRCVFARNSTYKEWTFYRSHYDSLDSVSYALPTFVTPIIVIPMCCNCDSYAWCHVVQSQCATVLVAMLCSHSFALSCGNLARQLWYFCAIAVAVVYCGCGNSVVLLIYALQQWCNQYHICSYAPQLSDVHYCQSHALQWP